MVSLKELQDWCRIICENYPNVEIRNMSTSFRDGLAFCAIIHKHRPDCIDFSSLSKNNVYENNSLAFEVAESKLGIPALLDPQDMVSTEVPDSLSVLTYLSHYFYYFNRKPHGVAGFARVSNREHASSRSWDRFKVSSNQQSSIEDQSVRDRLCVCACCRKHVHLVQRHRVEGKLYHRSCFRCSVCRNTLLPGCYREGSEAGSLVCTHHLSTSESHLDLSRSVAEMDFLPKLDGQGGPKLASSMGGFPDLSKSGAGMDFLPKLDGQGGPELPSSIGGLPDLSRSGAGMDFLPKLDGQGGPELPSSLGSFPDLSRSVAGMDVLPKLDGQGGPELASSLGGFPDLSRSVPLMDALPKLDGQELPSSLGGLPDLSRSVPEMDFLPKLDGQGGQELASSIGGVPDLSKSGAGMDVLPKLDGQELASSQGGLTDIPDLSHYTRKTDSLKGMAGGLGVTEGEDQNTMEERTSSKEEVQDRENTDGTVESKDELKKPPPPCPLQTPEEEGKLPEAGTPTTDRDEELQEETHSPEPCRPPGSSGLQAPEPPRRRSNPSTPPCPPPRTLHPKAMTSPTATGKSLPSSSDRTQKPKPKDPPWMSIVHPGPWTRLPPAPPPMKPPPYRSRSIFFLHGELHFQRMPAVNPFGQDKDEDEDDGDDGDEDDDDTGDEDTNRADQASGSASSHSKRACKQNPFNRRASTSDPAKAKPAPGYGFPLIKRKVQTDQGVPTENLEAEMGEVERQLDRLELRGVELEKSLRDCQNDQEEEAMLADWFNLVHEKHMLVRKDEELVYLTKQHGLEEKQADVEYELRCLLNKPESEWSEEDRSREQQFMEELVKIIDQRNQIISSLDDDRQKEKEEDELLADIIQRKDFHKEEEKDVKKTNKFRPMKMLKMLSHKVESYKDNRSEDGQKKKS